MDRIIINQITMKSIKTLFILIAAFSVALFAVEQSQAQDDPRAEAISLYNSAQELAGANEHTEAIEVYREALDVARANDLSDIVELIEQRLPRVAYSRASRAYTAYQNERTISAASTALDYFKAAKDVADEFGDDQVSQQAQGAIPQIYYIRSILHFRGDDIDSALADLETARDLNANYAVAYYQTAVVMKRKDAEDIEAIMDWYDQAIEVAQRVNDERTLNNARNGARDELIYRAVTLAEDRNFSRALELLDRVEQYDSESADAHYRKAEIYNERGRWDDALRHASRALELETGGVTDRAKIYFELGVAYKGKGDVPNACEAFENARYGDFTDPANHELQFELKCEGHTPTGRR